jgi:hypothetical protein
MRVRSTAAGDAVQFTGRQSITEISDLVGSLGRVRHAPARRGSTPAAPASKERALISLQAPSGQSTRPTLELQLGDWAIKTPGQVVMATEVGFTKFWEEIPETKTRQRRAKTTDTNEETKTDDNPAEDAIGPTEAAEGGVLQDEEGAVELQDPVSERGDLADSE